MAVLFSPIFNSQVVNDAGDPAVGWKIYTYVANSSTPLATYTTSAGNVQQSNPIVINALGFPTTGQIWLTQGQIYKLELTDENDVVQKTEDQISGVNDVSVSQDQWVASALTPTFISATSFSFAGDQTTTFTQGRRIKTANSGGTVYSTIVSSVFGAVTTIVVQNDGSGTIDSGISAVSYGIISSDNTSEPSLGDTYVCEGRLTLTSGTPVTTSDVTAAETVYFAPYKGNKIDLYDGAKWVRYKFTELSIDVPDATQMNDVFIYNNAGTLTLEVVAWTNDTTRATALVTQDGVLVKSGTLTKRYLGSFYGTTAGNGQTEDSASNRYLWNYYNRVRRSMVRSDTANSWTYSTASYQQANASAANQLNYCMGVQEDAVRANVIARALNSSATGRDTAVGIGVDSATVNSAQNTILAATAAVATNPSAQYIGYPGIGKRFLAWLEYANGGGADTITWLGDNGGTIVQTGISGEVWS